MSGFDIEGARKAGYSDTEIADHLAQQNKFDADSARKSGYSDTEIINHLSTPAPSQLPANYSPNLEAVAAGNPNVAKAEAIANVGTGMLATPIAGLAGLAQGVKNYFSPGMSAGDRVNQVQKALTYEPRTTGGQELTGAVQLPFQKLAQMADTAGTAVNNFNPARLIFPTAPKENPGGNPLAATAVNAAIQSLPALLTRGRAGVAAKTNPGAAAEAYVRANTSIDWSTLPDAAKARLTEIAKDQRTLDALDPKAIERQLQLESLPVPIKNASKGQLTRDPRQLQQEELLKSTDAGQALSKDALSQNRVLNENLDVLRNRTAGDISGNLELGRNIQDRVLRARMAEQEKGVQSLYTKAEKAGETLEPVDVSKLKEWYAQPENQIDAPYLGKLIDAFSENPKAAMEKFNAEMQKLPSSFDHEGPKGQRYAETYARIKSNLDKVGESDVITINDLERIRKKVVSNTQSSDGAVRHTAGQALHVIDDILDNSGSNIYREARAAHRALKQEFSNQSIISRLVENKDPATRATDLEATYKELVINSSVEELSTALNSIVKSKGGIQAKRNLAAQTIENIKQEATKGASNQAGEANSTYVALKRAIDRVGDDKLQVLIGKESTAQLRNVLKAAETLKTEPSGMNVRGSNTVNKIMNILDKSLITKIPILGDTAAGVVKGVAKLQELGKSSRDVRAAQETPITFGEMEAQKAAKRTANANIFRKFSGSTLATQREKQNAAP